MKRLLWFFLVCGVINVFAQNLQQEINSHVWKPFIKTFNERDTKAFMSLHSKDAVRSPRDGKTIWNFSEYYRQQEKGDMQEKQSGAARQLDLRFTERIANKDLAIEVGIYKTTYISTDGIVRSFYGRFHVILRKENDAWKILVDTDSSENNSITEKEFLAASPMNDLQQ
jgi:ketosteroid isomerase-like protein